MTDHTNQQIADILSGMRFSRRTPVTRQQKAQYAAMETEVADALKALSKLRLRLWYAVSRQDYHSLPLEEAKRTLRDIQNRLSVVAQPLENEK